MSLIRITCPSLVLLALLVCSNFVSADSEKKFRLGVIAPFSGSASVYGDAIKNGIEMALKDLGDKSRVEVVYEDDQFEPNKSALAFKRLVEVSKVDAVIVTASSPSNAVAPLAESAKIPLLAWASDAKVSKGRRYVLRTYPSGEAEGAAVAVEAKRRNSGKVAVYYSQNDYPLSVRNGFVSAYGKDQIAIDQELPKDLLDFKAEILRARKSGAQSFFLCINPGGSGVFAAQLAQLGMQPKIFGCENLSSHKELELSAGKLRGAFYATISVTDEFLKRYRQNHDNDSWLSGVAVSFDVINTLNALVEESKTKDLVQQLLALPESSGALSKEKYIKTDTDQYLDVPLRIKEVG